MQQTCEERGSTATVNVGPPKFSSKLLMSTIGTLPVPSDAVHAITYSRKGIPASINARVAAFTLAAKLPPSD